MLGATLVGCATLLRARHALEAGDELVVARVLELAAHSQDAAREQGAEGGRARLSAGGEAGDALALEQQQLLAAVAPRAGAAVEGDLGEDAVVAVVLAALGAVVAGVLQGLADVVEREVAGSPGVADPQVEAGAVAARREWDREEGPGLARAEGAHAEGRTDAPAIMPPVQGAAEVDGAADRRAAVHDRDQTAVDLDAAEGVEGQVREVDDPAAAAERDAVEEHADLLGRGAAQRQRGELTEAAEGAHGDAGAARQDLGQGVGGPGSAWSIERDRRGEAGAASVEVTLVGLAGRGDDDRAIGVGVGPGRAWWARAGAAAQERDEAGAGGYEARGPGRGGVRTRERAPGFGGRGDDGE